MTSDGALPVDEVFQRLGLALALGLLVGLQRERAGSRMAGIRTFPILTMLGTTCALLAERFGGAVVVAGLLAVASLALMSNLARPHDEPREGGQTTEAAALLMFALGAYLVVGSRTVAVAVGGVVAVLLYLKEPLRRLVGRITEEELRAVMQFVAISLVVLPVLPDRAYGPYDVLNPRQIWSMVLLIVAISMAGYAAFKLLGAERGTLLAGVLGGLISSTATTASYARRAESVPSAVSLGAIVIMVASTVAFARVLLEIAVVAPGVVAQMAPPLAAMLGLMTVVSVAAHVLGREGVKTMPAQKNPADFRSALLFAALYAVVTLGVAAAKDYFGTRGLYVVALVSGLTDMDAITLSTANLTARGSLDPATGWRLVFVAALANLVFKGGIVAALGPRSLLARIGVLYGVALAGGIGILWLWPDGA